MPRQSLETTLALGAFLREQRRLANLSLRRLALLSGVSDSYLSQVERGRYRPSAEVLTALAEALNLPLAHLYRYWGVLDDAPVATDVEQAIRLDPRLAEAHKEVLLQLYSVLVRESGTAS